jgi:hypothetical protein
LNPSAWEADKAGAAAGREGQDAGHPRDNSDSRDWPGGRVQREGGLETLSESGKSDKTGQKSDNEIRQIDGFGERAGNEH